MDVNYLHILANTLSILNNTDSESVLKIIIEQFIICNFQYNIIECDKMQNIFTKNNIHKYIENIYLDVLQTVIDKYITLEIQHIPDHTFKQFCSKYRNCNIIYNSSVINSILNSDLSKNRGCSRADIIHKIIETYKDDKIKCDDFLNHIQKPQCCCML